MVEHSVIPILVLKRSLLNFFKNRGKISPNVHHLLDGLDFCKSHLSFLRSMPSSTQGDTSGQPRNFTMSYFSSYEPSQIKATYVRDEL